MVKKIKKYAKFIVCVALIMGLIAPSYAALSASDGSAFVTKAEFDSALADFNARLTTFEAGINSKIDSQVTSYLDRNGIWNGKVQALKSYNETTNKAGHFISYIEANSPQQGAYWYKTQAADPYIYMKGALPNADTKSGFRGQDYYFEDTSTQIRVICENITKSGLANLVFNIRVVDGSLLKNAGGVYFSIAKGDYIQQLLSQINTWGCTWFFKTCSQSLFNAGALDSAKDVYSYQWTQAMPTGFMAGSKIVEQLTIPAYFFVEKGVTLYEYLVNSSEVNQTVAYTNKTAKTNLVNMYVEPVSLCIY